MENLRAQIHSHQDPAPTWDWLGHKSSEPSCFGLHQPASPGQQDIARLLDPEAMVAVQALHAATAPAPATQDARFSFQVLRFAIQNLDSRAPPHLGLLKAVATSVTVTKSESVTRKPLSASTDLSCKPRVTPLCFTHPQDTSCAWHLRRSMEPDLAHPAVGGTINAGSIVARHVQMGCVLACSQW